MSSASAAQLQQRSLRLSNNVPSRAANYEVSMELLTPGTLGSIKIDFCANLALLYYPCTPPAGFDVSGAAVSSQNGVSGFSVDPSTTANSLVITRTPSAVAAGLITITISGVTNQSYEGASFARYYTYASSDASGPVTDDGAVAYSINQEFGVSAEVPPYLTMCVAVTIDSVDCSDAQGSFLQLGQFSTARPTAGQSQLVLTTNAPDGYTVRIQGQTMISGNNAIPSLQSPTVSVAGQSQFGVNLRNNSNPATGNDPSGPGTGTATSDYGQADRFMFRSGDIIASNNSFEDYRKYTITYLVNIGRDQPPGVYASSFSYVALGNF